MNLNLCTGAQIRVLISMRIRDGVLYQEYVRIILVGVHMDRSLRATTPGSICCRSLVCCGCGILSGASIW